MLLYNEDILDILDQSRQLHCGVKWYCNKYYAYDLADEGKHSHIVELISEELNCDKQRRAS